MTHAQHFLGHTITNLRPDRALAIAEFVCAAALAQLNEAADLDRRAIGKAGDAIVELQEQHL